MSALLRSALIACSVALGLAAAADAKTLFRISTENTPQHHQTVLVGRFAQAIRDRAGDRLEVRFAHSAAMFRDADVVDAMVRGQLEMAVPGSWQLERRAPNLGVFLLPMFYGQPGDATRAVMASDVGRSIERELSLATGAHVLGAWLDLGYTHLYAKVPLTGLASLRGLRIRVAGGEANLARLRAFGAEAVIIPWPDFPQALAAGAVDGVLSSHATIASASLWQQGLLFAYEDREYFAQYVPLVGARFWQALPVDLRAIMTTAWAEVAAQAPAMAVRSQEEARKLLQEAGVRIVIPGQNEIAEARAILMAGQPVLVARLGLDPALVKRIEDALQRWP